jgi:hypothetical protein
LKLVNIYRASATLLVGADQRNLSGWERKKLFSQMGITSGILQCYYATREQCEFTVDYHGFCVANPYARPQTYWPRQRRG